MQNKNNCDWCIYIYTHCRCEARTYCDNFRDINSANLADFNGNLNSLCVLYVAEELVFCLLYDGNDLYEEEEYDDCESLNKLL